MHCKITRRNGNFILNDLGNEIDLESIKVSINDETSQKFELVRIVQYLMCIIKFRSYPCLACLPIPCGHYFCC